jgi:LuxR family transcriptional regulator, maltose regulon positive regulatory protein
MSSSAAVSHRHRRSRPAAAGPSAVPADVLPFRGAERLAEGWRALAEARWADAREAFVAALAGGESAEAYEGLATVAEIHGEGAETVVAREAAYRLYRRRGDRAAAARMAMLLGFAYSDVRGEVAVGHGWIRRAERLLEGMPPGPELASLRVWQAHIALVVDGDLGRARAAAGEACRIASELDLGAVETMARGQLGMIHALEGDVAGGLELLDETAAAGLAGEHDDLRAAGLGACYMLSTCEVLLDFVRARQWCERATEWAGRHDLAASGLFCRNHFCKVLLWRGEWDVLERELEGLLATFVSLAPSLLPGGRVQLAELRRRQGRRDEAHELLDASDAHSGALLVRAALALDEGREGQAVDLVERYFRRLDAGESLKRAPGLEILATAYVRRGDLAAAETVCGELGGVAEAAGTVGLRAAAAAARGGLALARGDADEARCRYEDAVDLATRAGAPFESGRFRRELARCLGLLGRGDEAREEAERAGAVLREIGAGPDAELAERLAAELAADPVRRPAGDGAAAGAQASPTAPRGVLEELSPREHEILTLVASGLANQEIAARLHLSLHTVKRHVANILTKLDLRSRTAAAALAVRRGLLDGR